MTEPVKWTWARQGKGKTGEIFRPVSSFSHFSRLSRLSRHSYLWTPAIQLAKNEL